MTQETIGKLLTTETEKDAIHVAVIPVIANEVLHPGQRVGLVPHSQDRIATSSKNIGIVDPFLEKTVEVDERCWLFLFPNTVVGMRHEWEHPAFGLTGQRAEAEQRLRALCSEWDIDFDETIAALLSGDKGICTRGESDEFERRELWDNYETYSGRRFDASHRESVTFSCWC